MTGKLSVRELQQNDIPLICDYWLNSDKAFLFSMGVDVAKIPPREELATRIGEQLNQPYKEKQAYCLIWEVDGEAIGHNNVNEIKFGECAYMHLHMWKPGIRKKGIGAQLVKRALPYFFKNLELETLYCEPYALNPAPNKTLPKLGFTFVKEHVCVPGWICFEQKVNLWKLSLEKLRTL